MATFLLVHGMWHGTWCWDRLVALLEERGHHAIAVPLPGMIGPDDDIGLASLDCWSKAVVEAARSADETPILVGHSRGGLIVSQAAEYDPAAFLALVYVTAIVLPDSVSNADIVSHLPADGLAGIVASDDGRSTTFKREVAAALMYQTTHPAIRDAALDRLQPDPSAIFSEPVSVSAERFGKVRKYYVECLRDLTLPIEFQRSMQANFPVEKCISLDCDHSPMASCPDDLANALIWFATAAGSHRPS